MQGENERQWKKSEQEHVRRVTRSFWKFHVVTVVQNNGKDVQKKCAARAKLLFLLIRPIVVFHRSPTLPSQLCITRFYILFEQTVNIIEGFAFSPG